MSPSHLYLSSACWGTGHRVQRVSAGGTFGTPQLADLTDGLMGGWVDGWVSGRMDEGLMDSGTTRWLDTWVYDG